MKEEGKPFPWIFLVQGRGGRGARGVAVKIQEGSWGTGTGTGPGKGKRDGDGENIDKRFFLKKKHRSSFPLSFWFVSFCFFVLLGAERSRQWQREEGQTR